MKWWIGLFVCLFSAAVSAVDSLRIAGQVLNVSPEESVAILREGKRLPASAGAVLYSGDRFEFSGESHLNARVYGEEIEFSSVEGTAEIPPKDIGEYGREEAAFFERYLPLLNKLPTAVPTFPDSRDSTAPSRPPSADWAAPTGRQKITRELKALALVWKDGSARLRIKPGPSKEFSSHPAAWILMPLDPDNTRYNISSQDQALYWVVEIEDRCPEPPWLRNHEGRRVLRALWLLEDERYREWRVFAISELAQMAQASILGADSLWERARNYELKTFIREQLKGKY